MTSIESTGTLTANGTAQTVATTTTNGVYLVRVDLTLMQAGDIARLWCAVQVNEGAGSVSKPINTFNQSGVYNDGSTGAPAILELGPLISTSTTGDGTITFFIKQTAGTNRNYFWQLVKVV